MIVRIVKLEFDETKIDEFIRFFDTVKEAVSTFEGCHGMKLLQDVNNPCIVVTYSHWINENALNSYRDSELFGKVWPKIKKWFVTKPEAWTVTQYFDGFDSNKGQ